jgi:predicted MPP superfamily phosphohydrolase
MLRTLIFLAVVLLVLCGSSVYMAERSMALCPALARHPDLVWGFLGLFVALLFAAPILHRLPTLSRRVDPVFWLSYVLFSFVSTYLVYLVAADLVQALARLLTGVRIGPWAFAAAAAGALASVVLGCVTAMRPVGVRRVEVPIPDLPPGLDGFRIVQISDLHLGPLVRWAQVEHVLAASNALEPDLIAVTGDLVDGEADAVRAKAVRLGELRAVHGVYFVTGNHEYYSGVARWLGLIRNLGWKVLDNEHVLLEHRGAQLAVAGMPDPTAGSRPGAGPDLARALAGIPQGALRLLLFHPPTGVEAAERAGVQLQLSGHTHAGQYFPWSLVIPFLFAHPRGLGRSGRLWIYTSVGTGFWGPPNRFLVPPELTLLVLRRPGGTATSIMET